MKKVRVLIIGLVIALLAGILYHSRSYAGSSCGQQTSQLASVWGNVCGAEQEGFGYPELMISLMQQAIYNYNGAPSSRCANNGSGPITNSGVCYDQNSYACGALGSGNYNGTPPACVPIGNPAGIDYTCDGTNGYVCQANISVTLSDGTTPPPVECDQYASALAQWTAEGKTVTAACQTLVIPPRPAPSPSATPTPTPTPTPNPCGTPSGNFNDPSNPSASLNGKYYTTIGSTTNPVGTGGQAVFTGNLQYTNWCWDGHSITECSNGGGAGNIDYIYGSLTSTDGTCTLYVQSCNASPNSYGTLYYDSECVVHGTFVLNTVAVGKGCQRGVAQNFTEELQGNAPENVGGYQLLYTGVAHNFPGALGPAQ